MAERHHAFHARQQDEEEDPHPAPAPAVAPEPEPEPATAPVSVAVPAAQTMPSAHVMPAAGAPTLTQAFTVLCAALQGHLDDNAVLAAHCDEIQAWMQNTGGDERHSNAILAWRHAVSILAEVLGQPMTLG